MLEKEMLEKGNFKLEMVKGTLGNFYYILAGEGFVFAIESFGRWIVESPKKSLYYYKDGKFFYIPEEYYSKYNNSWVKINVLAQVKWNEVDFVERYIHPDVAQDPVAFSLKWQQQEKEKREQERNKNIMESIENVFNVEMNTAIQVKEFNKKYASEVLLTKEVKENGYVRDGKKFIILHDYLTRCLNHTIIYAIIPATAKEVVIKVPQELMGLVIGKQGSNIKEIQRKYNIKIKLEAV